MTVGIVGLGLIGGSMALAYKKHGHTVLALDRDTVIRDYALMAGAADGVLDEINAEQCDLLLLALPPREAADWLGKLAPRLRADTLVLDCCGTKRRICAFAFPLAERYGFTFVGGHPMAGTQYSGFKYAKDGMFRGAPMVIVPPVFDDMALLDRVMQALAPAEFGSFSVTTAEKHDEMIAFTSQLAHVVSNAYVKSPEAQAHRGFSAGSYTDLTRVARLNAPMWTELFLENGDFLLREIDTLTENLRQYRDALASEDEKTLCALLEEGSRIKKEVDGR